MTNWQVWKKRCLGALLLGAVAAQASAATPVLSIVASPAPALSGTSVALDVLVTGIADLYAFQFSLGFNPTVLQATGGTEGSFMPGAGATYFGAGTIDNTLGSVSFVFDSLIGAVPGVNGAGVLAHLTFNATAVGSSALTFSDVLFLDAGLADITVQAQNSVLQVQAVPEPASLALIAAGLAGVAGLAAARRRASA